MGMDVDAEQCAGLGCCMVEFYGQSICFQKTAETLIPTTTVYERYTTTPYERSTTMPDLQQDNEIMFEDDDDEEHNAPVAYLNSDMGDDSMNVLLAQQEANRRCAENYS